MTQSQRFRAIFNREKPDRLPVLYFGYWEETLQRWQREGLADINNIPGMDPDWEFGMWDCFGMTRHRPAGEFSRKTIEENENYIIAQSEIGEVVQISKQGTSISHTLKYALEPTRQSWERFKKFLDPNDPYHRADDWPEKAAKLAQTDVVRTFFGGSLYGLLREWMGVEQISLLMYDDPELFEEMVCYMADYYIALYGPILDRAEFDFVYICEDCCGKTGPLFSPEIYKRVFDPCYKKLLGFYKQKGVPFALVDSDGYTEPFIPLWLESGFDIIFPVEVGSWRASPADLRGKFGLGMGMFGGVDKHVIAHGEDAVRRHLLALKPVVEQGGFIPIPDHRMPPECSYQDFLTYIKVFNEVFNA